MRSGTIAFLAGCTAIQWLPALPDLTAVRLSFVALPLFAAVALFGPGRTSRLTGAFAAGTLWAGFHAAAVLAQALPQELEKRDLVVQGRIAGLPEVQRARVRFDFLVTDARYRNRPIAPPGTLRLSWYDDAPPLKAGERWELEVRLKRAHGMANPHTFDYEQWLFQRGIGATGYVRESPGNRRIGVGKGPQAWRQGLRDRIASHLPELPGSALVLALTVGDRNAITDSQWNVLRRTGTNHLMAISGLHIGLVAGLVFFLVRRFWPWPARFPSPRAAAVVAVSAAAGYALLAGFSIPTQRAFIMVAAVMGSVLFKRRWAASDMLALSLLLVLLFDPASVMAFGFWLSFGAVAAILYGMSGRLRPDGLWWRWGRVQWLIGLALAPFTLLFFQSASLIGPLANSVLVPYVGFSVVPAALAGALLLPLWAEGGGWLLALATHLLEMVWPLLQWAASFELASWTGRAPPAWATGAALLGAVWLMAPRGLPARWVGALWLLPILLMRSENPPPGEFRAVILDVGQGLASVVTTTNHVLVYDAGPRYRSGFDTGKMVVEPYLRGSGIEAVDLAVISHEGMDHAGGYRHLRRNLPVRRTLSGSPAALDLPPSDACRAGQAWEWDGVRFEFLHPETNRPGNDGSCVLRVIGTGGRLLLTGDIEAPAEKVLVERAGGGIEAEVLVVPHHGSRTSSTDAFVTAVGPRHALFSVGYRNRFGFPVEAVVDRYRRAGARVWETAASGALRVEVRSDGIEVTGYRSERPRYWMR